MGRRLQPQRCRWRWGASRSEKQQEVSIPPRSWKETSAKSIWMSQVSGSRQLSGLDPHEAATRLLGQRRLTWPSCFGKLGWDASCWKKTFESQEQMAELLFVLGVGSLLPISLTPTA